MAATSVSRLTIGTSIALAFTRSPTTLAYTAHDLDDGLMAGVLSTHELEVLEIWRLVCDRVGWHDGALDEVLGRVFSDLVGGDILGRAGLTGQSGEPTDPLVALAKKIDQVLGTGRAMSGKLRQHHGLHAFVGM